MGIAALTVNQSSIDVGRIMSCSKRTLPLLADMYKNQLSVQMKSPNQRILLP